MLWQAPPAQEPMPPSGSWHCSKLRAPAHPSRTQLSPCHTAPGPHGTGAPEELPPVDEAPELATPEEELAAVPLLPAPVEPAPLDRPVEPVLEEAPGPPVVLEVDAPCPPQATSRQPTRSGALLRTDRKSLTGEAIYRQLPLWQLVPAEQITPHVPQLALSVSTFVQPTPGQQR